MRFHRFVQDGEGWGTREREVLFANPFLEVHRVQVTSPARQDPFEWTVCHRKAGVAVAAQAPCGGFVMVRQERVPLRAHLWEFPAGQIDETGKVEGEQAMEVVVATGLRELGEEAGYELGPEGEVVSMRHFLSSPGFTDEHTYLLWLRGVVPRSAGPARDAAEAISEVRVFSISELRHMVVSGEIRDANTLCALARLTALGGWESAR
ncbi:MAG: hypothetical protein RLZZ399_389 [Verrucomicrobiota bacterium]|jgi:ADP-ribose pyrophosphatase